MASTLTWAVFLAAVVSQVARGQPECNYVTFNGLASISPDGECFHSDWVGEAGLSYRAECTDEGDLTVWEHPSMDCSGEGIDVTHTDDRIGDFECGLQLCPVVFIAEDQRSEDEQSCSPDDRGAKVSRTLQNHCIDLTSVLGGEAHSLIMSGCAADGRVVVGQAFVGSSACEGEGEDLLEWTATFEADCYLECRVEDPASSDDDDDDVSSSSNGGDSSDDSPKTRGDGVPIDSLPAGHDDAAAGPSGPGAAGALAVVFGAAAGWL